MHLGTFPGERLSRSRGYDAPSAPPQDECGLVVLILSIVVMYIVIGAGLVGAS